MAAIGTHVTPSFELGGRTDTTKAGWWLFPAFSCPGSCKLLQTRVKILPRLKDLVQTGWDTFSPIPKPQELAPNIHKSVLGPKHKIYYVSGGQPYLRTKIPHIVIPDTSTLPPSSPTPRTTPLLWAKPGTKCSPPPQWKLTVPELQTDRPHTNTKLNSIVDRLCFFKATPVESR